MEPKQAFYIQANKNFLEELALGILGRFQNISDISILLPSQRSCIEFESILLKHLSKPFLMPHIIPIGTLGKDNQLTENLDSFNEQRFLSEFEHKLHIAQIIYKKKKGKVSYIKILDIATSLSDIITKCTRDQVPLTKIKNLYLSDNAAHIEELIEYLYIIIDEWPNFLKKNHSIDYLNDGNIYIDQIISKWQTSPPDKPIIAAGSTGSIKSTASLIKALSNIKNGFVVLKGIDLEMNQQQWNNIDKSHHAFLTKQLLNKIEIDKKQLIPWHSKDYAQDEWQNFISTAMTPSNSTIEWHNYKLNSHIRNLNTKLVECSNTQEEAMVIALRVREILAKDQNANIAIIANNRDLTNRIILLAEIWDIPIYNSHGTALHLTPKYNFLTTILNAVSENFTPVSLLALLKHPIFNITFSDIKQKVEQLEITFLRGICRYDNLQQLINIVEAKEQNELAEILHYVGKACDALIQYSKSQFINFKKCITEVIKATEALSDSNNQSSIWSDDDGQILYKYLDDIVTSSHLMEKIKFHNIPNIFKALLHNKTSVNSKNSNIKILSNIESRLLSFDHVIIAGLNEGNWPAKMRFDPWLTNNIYNLLDLTPPELTIGQAAYDFFCLLQQKNVLLTRAITSNGAATSPTRWLVRIETLAQKIGILDIIKPKQHYLKEWTKHLLYHDNIENTEKQTPIRPIVLNGLKKLSVTQVEKLIRDPYSIYTSTILGLKKLDPLEKQPDQKDFGIFIHSVMDQFNKLYDSSNDHKQMLHKISAKTLNEITENQTIKHLWQLKFDQMSPWILKFEQNKRHTNDIKIYTEISSKINILPNFTLSMKADRIEVNKDLVTIIDFKTGSVPTQQDVKLGFSPQLPLEALILSKGIEHINIETTNIQLSYVQLTPGKNLGKVTAVNLTPEIANDYITEGLSNLIKQFNEGTPFLISPRKNKALKYNEISHLERVE